ncbi:MAG: hypothetical protein LBP59_20705 [Planctomycetaceae bacterium]|jgi:thiol-disulfide isomerase/thioredoxin|nr:hypothetical protein [Planctomycetaceae bacterium]
MSKNSIKISFLRVNLFYFIVLFCLAFDGCSCSNNDHDHEHDSGHEHGHEHGHNHSKTTNPQTDSTTKNNNEQIKNNEKNAMEILNNMVKTYRNAKSYADHGRGMIVGKMTQPDAEPVTWSCTVAFKKPDKLRIECNEGKLVSNNNNCYALIRSLPDQVLSFSTPQSFKLDKLFSDVELDQSMNIVFPSGIIRFPPQLILLFADDPLKTFLPEGSKTELLEPQSIGNIPCDVIKIKHENGDRALWISKRNSALLRFDYMVEGLLVAAEFESVRTIRIDMNDAQLDLPIAEEAFHMLQPINAKKVSEFKPVEMEILGKKLTNTESLNFEELILSTDNLKNNLKEKSTKTATDDLTNKTNNTASEKPEKNINANNTTNKTNDKPTIPNETTPKIPLRKSVAELNGKIAAFCFWTTWSEPCRQAIEEFYKAENANLSKDNIQFFVINSDGLGDGKLAGDNKKLLDLASQYCISWGLRQPYWYEVGGKLTGALAVDSFPAIVVLGSDSRVEFYSRGGMQATAINDLLKQIKEGKKPYEKNLNDLQKILQQRKIQHANELKLMTDKGIFASIRMPVKNTPPEVTPQTPPKTFMLEKKWETPLVSTGNIAVLKIKKQDKIIDKTIDKQDKKNNDQIDVNKIDANKIDANKVDVNHADQKSETVLLVPCEGNRVAFIDADGKIIKKVTPAGFSNDELLTLVRTSVDLCEVGAGGNSEVSGCYIGFSSNSGSVVHIFDVDLKPLLRYTPHRQSGEVKLKISDFKFADIDGVGEPEVVVGMVAIDGNVAGGDAICAIDLAGKEIWRDDAVTYPFQVSGYNYKGKRGAYVLDAIDSAAGLRKYSADGKRLLLFNPAGKHVRNFLFDAASGNLCTIISAADGDNVEMAMLQDTGSISWRQALPVGEYNLATVDLFGDTRRQWIAVSRLGAIFIVDKNGKLIDSFAIGEPVTGLTVIAGQIIVATGNKVIAWKIKK